MSFSGILTDPIRAQAQKAFQGFGDSWLRPDLQSFQFNESPRPIQLDRSSAVSMCVNYSTSHYS